MKNKVTIIITIRNRDVSRIENQVNSIRKYGANPTIHIIDYGSDEVFKNQYEVISNKLGIQYTHMFAEGLPWNKCRAINYGVKNATTPFIVTSDVDMIYTSNPFQWCIDNYEEKTIYHIPTFWLPKNGKISKSLAAGIGNSGGFLFSKREDILNVNGYDERIVYWGVEDLDFPRRLVSQGYKQVWLPDEHKLYHQWHKTESNSHNRPSTASINSFKYSLDNYISPILSSEIGLPLTQNERPILSKIKNHSPFELHFNINEFTKWGADKKLIDAISQHNFVKVTISERLKTRPLDFFRTQMKSILKPFVALTGNKVISNINENFDYLYESIQTLVTYKLIVDFYISKDTSTIYLLHKE